MIELPSPLLLALAGEAIKADAVRLFIIGGVVMGGLVIGVYFVLKNNRPKPGAIKASLEEEFNKSKDALLLAAQAKKAAKEREEGQQRQLSAEEKERELLRENVDPALVMGTNCPICGLALEDDQELIIDPYSGQGYHLSSFLSGWPPDSERPKFVYRYPQGTVVRTSDFMRSL
jgi:hypothetical protein